MHAIGTADKPIPPLNLVGDYGGGALYLAFGLMAALYERQQSGQGQVDAAMVDGAGSLMSIFHGLVAAGRWDPPADAPTCSTAERPSRHPRDGLMAGMWRWARWSPFLPSWRNASACLSTSSSASTTPAQGPSCAKR